MVRQATVWDRLIAGAGRLKIAPDHTGFLAGVSCVLIPRRTPFQALSAWPAGCLPEHLGGMDQLGGLRRWR
ncbi:hypothetical protein GCM10010844_29080 [Deinococcus radiotolerans]|uniref:Uncharacterized protein n=1 Tax=Deinococcus radiotolerans TaxID=1309407 RepID=A0ABQ2FL10_9DEIO|nr:hypothetical protein GCM10010844_29080 [Deinococcus radiotolerans]